MNILIVGAGAIGGWLAGALAQAGASPALLARGAALEAIRAHGLRIHDGDEKRSYAIAAAARATELPEPEAVIFAVKNQDFLSAAEAVAPVLRPGVLLVTAMNGVPWWFLRGVEGPLKDATLETIDPGGRVAALLAPAVPAAAVVHASTRVAAPGVIAIGRLDKLILGEPSGENSEPLRELSRLIESTGLSAPLSRDIRLDIWTKLWGNMSMNPVSALTRLSSQTILGDPMVAGVLRAMMEEFAAVGEAVGLRAPMTVDERWAITRKLGDFRTSMLNDAEAGRPLEIEGLVGVVIEMADRVGVPAPTTRTVRALAHGLDLRAS